VKIQQLFLGSPNETLDANTSSGKSKKMLSSECNVITLICPEI
jgi:hypothetical protein